MAKRKLDEVQASAVPNDDAGIDAVPESINGNNSNAGSDSDVEEDEAKTEEETIRQQGRPTKKQRKQLSAQEIQVARETAELFKSNIFKMQIDELVSEVKIKESNVSRIEKVLHRLHGCILQIPASESLTLEEAENLINPKKVVIPFPDPKPTKTNYKFGYLPPEDVSLVGSFGFLLIFR